MTDQELKDLVAQLAVSQSKTDAQLAKTDAQLAKTDDKLDRLAEMVGGISNNQGKVAEDFFFQSLQQQPVLRGVAYDVIDKNVLRSTQGLQEEYDLILYNGAEVFILEVKYRLHPKDIERLVKRKGPNFSILFPQYRNYRQHLGLATFSVEPEVLQEALAQGITVLQRRGEVFETLPL